MPSSRSGYVSKSQRESMKALAFFSNFGFPSLFHASDSESESESDDADWSDEWYEDDDAEDDGEDCCGCICCKPREQQGVSGALTAADALTGHGQRRTARKKPKCVGHPRAALLNVSPWDNYPTDQDTAALDKAIRSNLSSTVRNFVTTLRTKRAAVSTRTHVPTSLPNALRVYATRCFEATSINLLFDEMEATAEVLDVADELKALHRILDDESGFGASARVIDAEIVRKLILLMWKFSAMAVCADKLLVVFNRSVKSVEKDFVDGPNYLRTAAEQNRALEKISKSGPPNVNGSSQLFFDVFWLLSRVHDESSSGAVKFNDCFPPKEKAGVKEALRSYLVSCCKLRLDELLKPLLVSQRETASNVRPGLKHYLQKTALPAVKKYLEAKQISEQSNPALPDKKQERKKTPGTTTSPLSTGAKIVESSPSKGIKATSKHELAVEALRSRKLTVSMTDPPEFVEHVLSCTLKLVDLTGTIIMNGYTGTEKDSLKNASRTVRAFPHFVLSIGRALHRVNDGKHPVVSLAKGMFLDEWMLAEEKCRMILQRWLQNPKSCPPSAVLDKLREDPAVSHLSVEIMMRDSGVVSYHSGKHALRLEEINRIIAVGPVLGKFAHFFTTTEDFDFVA